VAEQQQYLASPGVPLAPRVVARMLGAMHEAVRAEVLALPAEARRWHPAPGEWCVNEALGHLIEAERRGFAGRIRQMLAESEPHLAAWDQVAVARQRGDCERDTAEILRELSELRAASVALVAALTPADLQRGAVHRAVGYLRVGEIIHEWLHHDRNHVRQIYANIQSYVWPAMGNAQRFSQP
jgi:hypothetical protein